MTTLFGEQARQATKAGGIESLESIPGLLKCLQIQYGLSAWMQFVEFSTSWGRRGGGAVRNE